MLPQAAKARITLNGKQSALAATFWPWWGRRSADASIDRLVVEFFTVKAGRIQEVQAVLTNLPDAEPTGWDTRWYGPGRGGVGGPMPARQ